MLDSNRLCGFCVMIGSQECMAVRSFRLGMIVLQEVVGYVNELQLWPYNCQCGAEYLNLILCKLYIIKTRLLRIALFLFSIREIGINEVRVFVIHTSIKNT